MAALPSFGRLGVGLVISAGLMYALARSGSAKPLPEFQPTTRSVLLDGKKYTIVAMGKQTFLVFNESNPAVVFIFGPSGPISRTGNTATIESDLKRFPSDLFK